MLIKQQQKKAVVLSAQSTTMLITQKIYYSAKDCRDFQLTIHHYVCLPETQKIQLPCWNSGQPMPALHLPAQQAPGIWTCT